MDFSRIQHVIDVRTMQQKCVTIVGLGGGANLARNLVRSGLGRVQLFDMDTVGPENICRQEQMADQIGMTKVSAVKAELLRINPAVHVARLARDFCSLTDVDIDRVCADTDVLVACVDNLAACARVNEVALRRGTPAVFSGLYPQGRAGEVVFWRPELDCCYRCLCADRYEAAARGEITNAASDGADILTVQLLDSIAGMLVIGLLTQGSDTRYARLVADLGDRQFIQIKIDPSWTIGGGDPVATYLGIAPGNDAYVSFCTVARRDPDQGQLHCPDCERFRHHVWAIVNGSPRPVRIVCRGRTAPKIPKESVKLAP